MCNSGEMRGEDQYLMAFASIIRSLSNCGGSSVRLGLKGVSSRASKFLNLPEPHYPQPTGKDGSALSIKQGWCEQKMSVWGSILTVMKHYIEVKHYF